MPPQLGVRVRVRVRVRISKPLGSDVGAALDLQPGGLLLVPSFDRRRWNP